jgi:hypothetical protein
LRVYHHIQCESSKENDEA